MAILTRMEIGLTVIGMGIVTAIALATTTGDYTAGGISMSATMMVIATATRAVTAGAGGCQPAINRVSTATTRAGCNRRDNNREQISSMEKRMWDLMDHNNIPREVPFGEVASRR